MNLKHFYLFNIRVYIIRITSSELILMMNDDNIIDGMMCTSLLMLMYMIHVITLDIFIRRV